MRAAFIKKSLFLACLALMLGAGPASGTALAGEPPPSSVLPGNEPPIPPAAPPTSYADVPDEYIMEAQGFYDECESTPRMNKYYDCECLSVKFLDERIRRGSDAHRSSIILSIEKECLDATWEAGDMYQQCLGDPMIPANIPAEDYCTCLANTFAKLFKNYGMHPGSDTYVRVKTEAIVACRNPSLAKELYPYQPKAK